MSRNIGVPLGHTLVALASLARGLDKLTLNEAALEADLTRHWAVVAEGVQTILRREQYPAPYEALKDATRGKPVDEAAMRAVIASLDVSAAVKAELGALTPRGVCGVLGGG